MTVVFPFAIASFASSFWNRLWSIWLSWVGVTPPKVFIISCFHLGSEEMMKSNCFGILVFLYFPVVSSDFYLILITRPSYFETSRPPAIFHNLAQNLFHMGCNSDSTYGSWVFENAWVSTWFFANGEYGLCFCLARFMCCLILGFPFFNCNLFNVKNYK